MATVISDTEHVEVATTIDSDGRWLIDPGSFEALTGWTLKPEGMCRDEVCAPIYRPAEVISPDGLIDLEQAAPIIGMTTVVDSGRGVAAMAASAQSRGEQMTSLRAPDFTLPDMAGNLVSLHDFDHRKVLLLAWSSW